MNLLAEIYIHPLVLIVNILCIIGLMALVRMHSRQATIWQATSKALAKQAYDQGRADEAKARILPLDERVSNAYHRGVRDSTREWIRMIREKGLDVRRTSDSEFEVFEKEGSRLATLTLPHLEKA